MMSDIELAVEPSDTTLMKDARRRRVIVLLCKLSLQDKRVMLH